MKKYIIIVLLVLFGVTQMNAELRDPQRGYRGFVESENYIIPNLGFIAGDGGDSDFWTGVSTVHGYQINPRLFVGAGMSCIWQITDDDSRSDNGKLRYLPLFADVRTDLRFGRFTPFADLRVGCNLLKHGAFSGALTIGYRFSWGRRVALNLALGVNMIGRRYENIQSGWSPEEGPWSKPTGTYSTGYDVKPVLRFGIEF